MITLLIQPCSALDSGLLLHTLAQVKAARKFRLANRDWNWPEKNSDVRPPRQEDTKNHPSLDMRYSSVYCTSRLLSPRPVSAQGTMTVPF